jgi:hypothetical protein
MGIIISLGLILTVLSGCSAEAVRDTVYDNTYPARAMPDDFGRMIPPWSGTPSAKLFP